MPNILDPIELLHTKSVDALVDTCDRGSSAACADRIAGRILLQMDVLVVLDDILFDFVISLWTTFLISCSVTNRSSICGAEGAFGVYLK